MRQDKNISAFTIGGSAVSTKKESTELPAGLTEATIKLNMDKYNKTREEVILKYSSSRGKK